MRPVGAELELHGNASDHANQKIDAEYPGPKTRRLIVDFPTRTQAKSLQNHNQGREPHGELGEKIMKSYSEGKMQAVNQERTIHDELSLHGKYPHFTTPQSVTCVTHETVVLF